MSTFGARDHQTALLSKVKKTNSFIEWKGTSIKFSWQTGLSIFWLTIK